MDLPDFNERYEVEFPTMSLHNFIIGTPYIDIGEQMKIHKEGSRQKCFITFHRRGWFGKGDDVCKLDGSVFMAEEEETKQKKSKKNKVEPLMLITGNWNADINL